MSAAEEKATLVNKFALLLGESHYSHMKRLPLKTLKALSEKIALWQSKSVTAAPCEANKSTAV